MKIRKKKLIGLGGLKRKVYFWVNVCKVDVANTSLKLNCFKPVMVFSFQTPLLRITLSVSIPAE